MDSSVWQALIATVGTVVVAALQLVLNVKLAKLAKVAAITHGLVNDAMTNQLRINAIALQRISALTEDPVDKALAKSASEKYEAHENRHSGLEGDAP